MGTGQTLQKMDGRVQVPFHRYQGANSPPDAEGGSYASVRLYDPSNGAKKNQTSGMALIGKLLANILYPFIHLIFHCRVVGVLSN